MLQGKYKNKNNLKILTAAALLCTLLFSQGQPFSTVGLAVADLSEKAYYPGTIDTNPPPEKISYDITELTDYEEIHQTESLVYYYREDRDILAVYDKVSGYLWKTGLDLEFNSDIDDRVNEAPAEKKSEAAIPKEDRLNTIYTGFANSLLTAQYYDSSQNIKMISSASAGGVESKLTTVNNDPSHRRLDVNFYAINLTVSLHIHLEQNGITYEIRKDEISGTGLSSLAAFIISPFLGAVGGQKVHYNPETDAYDIKVPNPIIPGYVMIPDGPGALVRFEDNNTSLKTYTGSVYGQDLGQNSFYQTAVGDIAAPKEPLMPVFGIAHGDKQAAFVAYANQGAEYLEIEVSPEENMTYYTFAYPRFVVNRLYHQVYNKKGDGYFSLFKEPNSYDLSMTYTFLHGDGTDGTPAADYTGMAKVYREYLLESGSLTVKHFDYNTVPLRLDFIMSDIKKGILGYTNVVTTTASDVKDILENVITKGIHNINAGLYGFQNNGITGGKPWAVDYSRKIGKRAEFRRLVAELKQLGMDASFAQDYTRINSIQMNLRPNWSVHVNGWGMKQAIAPPGTLPVHDISFANPAKSAQWLSMQTRKLSRLGMMSVTIEGMSEILMSHYGSKPISRMEGAHMIAQAFEETAETYTINASRPNAYLWKHVDRFLKTPVFPTQYIIETDTVPFLQLVLHGTMELYAPYSNFSFYTQKDILRMIDYNVSPSFALTREPSYQLSSTNSSSFYSTEYSLYEPIIEEVYGKVNGALSHTIGRDWIGRRVVEEGVIVNSYSGGLEVLINYTAGSIEYKGLTVEPEDYDIIWE